MLVKRTMYERDLSTQQPYAIYGPELDIGVIDMD